MTDDLMIELRDVHKQFTKHPVLDGVSFSAGPGTVTLLAGPNGSGKTTAIGVLLGLVRPDRGWAGFGGSRYAELRRPLQHVGVVSDAARFDDRLAGRTVLQLVATAAGVPHETANRLLAEAGLASAARTKLGDYSLGMKRRLAIAAALIGDPQVLILDEPTSGLDAEGVEWLLSRVRSHRDAGGSTLLVTHQQSEAAALADQIVLLRDGRVEPTPEPQDFATPALDSAEALR